MTFKPPPELVRALLPMYQPCPGFAGNCGSAVRWDPQAGHIPRGFRGATGSIEEVRLILVTAEPGDPYPSESHGKRMKPADYLHEAYVGSTRHVAEPGDVFNRNIRSILGLAWPGVTFEEQMRRTLITASVFCSASQEGASVPTRVERECMARYIAPHLDLFSNARVVALGSKAQRRLGRTGVEFTAAFAAAPPGSNRREARPSWAAAVAGLQ